MPADRRQREQQMTLQNRVDPFGQIHAVASRGLFTGNRGVIHDPATKTLRKRRWSTRAWIVCALEHPNGRRRQPMGRNAPSGQAGWTELFFLDEVTAFAAGHRPCFYCRREAAKRYQGCFSAGNHLAEASAPAMDAVLHAQRLERPRPSLSAEQIASLPDGAMIAADRQALAVRAGQALAWSFSGYQTPRALPRQAVLLTPAASVAVLHAGYAPAWHGSARTY